jgi:acetylglutamate/LysW-gamma-L-alpha-aminoadipate kinase
VLTPPALSEAGEAINVDGDKLALQLAQALRADALILLSNTAGLLADLGDADSLVRRVDVTDEADVERALAAAGGRMKKKVQAGIAAVEAGIPTVVFADARIERPVSAALAGQGTVVTRVTQAVGART